MISFTRMVTGPGYALMAEGRYLCYTQFGFGAQYDYLRAAHLPDKMHVHLPDPCNLTYSVGQRKQKCVLH